jgi:hypothetical protein
MMGTPSEEFSYAVIMLPAKRKWKGRIDGAATVAAGSELIYE